MKRLLASLTVVLTATAAPALAQDSLLEDAQSYFEAIPTVVPAPKDNAIIHDKVHLGKMLYFDPRLSSSHLLSCNTRHNVDLSGANGLSTSVGHGWQKEPRNAPTVLNALFKVAQFWDGHAEDLKTQAKGPIQAGVEMNSKPERVVKVLKSMPTYVDAFAAAFPGEEDPVTFDNVAKAIEAFETTPITPSARFDQYLEGNANVLTDHEKKGLQIFMDKGCVACHNGVNIGGNDYYPFGVVEQLGANILPRNDKGRFAVTDTATDQYVFRAPPLRNLVLTAPYFHSGNVWNLKQAMSLMGTAQAKN
ncbi:cytochrome-c peroxidase [Breoghania sp.]|uniref:cytochrome-c peroxidase n=1 Tax=Breoghania sp. TaxID=2065378 RepID=UPI00320467BE